MLTAVELRTGRSRPGGACYGGQWLLCWILLSSLIPGVVADPGFEFFEQKIRPILVDNCYSCHSATAEKIKGGLLLDSREALLKGGETGPVLVPGDPDKSLLVKAVRYTDADLRMPPKNKKLSADQIAALEQWVRMGAPDPRSHDLQTPQVALHAPKHWAFQPIKPPPLPPVRNTSWIQQPLDAFVLARLESKGLSPSPQADKRTLIRRASLDLTGLPPTFEEVEAFLADDSPEAFVTVVDRLLASPRYGERWARHWLDVARYADTKGYVFEERRYPYAYTYRDYVIGAFNQDLPFDQFIVEQIAADQLPLGEDKRALAALGYLTLGRRFLNNQHDIIDDRIDVVTRGMMGLTVACARCHDHKFDPISTRDYYSLYGVFANCTEPEEQPLLGTKSLPPQYPEYLEAHRSRLAELNQFRTTKEAEVRAQLRQSAGEYMLAAHDAQQLSDKSRAEALARERKLDPGTLQRWVKKLDALRPSPQDRIFAPWLTLAECSGTDLSSDAQEILKPLVSSNDLNPLVAHAFEGTPPTSLREVSERYGRLFAEVDTLWQAAVRQSNASPSSSSVAALPDPCFEELRQVLYASDSATTIPDAEITRLFDVPSIQKLRALKRSVEELDATHPGAPPRAMTLQDRPALQTAHVLIRGNPAMPGPEVPRQFVTVLAGPTPRPFQMGSGRLELAQAIASRENPLTARVFVNRVWLQFFGSGLVRTPSDFGLRSDPPSHPELLDHLAARFMDEGWSVKKLHRWIVLSSTYQQVSDANRACAQADPNNQLLAKMNRRRLDFEATRDSLLAVSGTLDLTAGGHSVDIQAGALVPRRTVYGFIERQNLPSLFRTFDFASPDTTSPQRFSTTVPQQALFMINSSFVAQQARALVRRLDAGSDTCAEGRVASLYKLVYQREPTAGEIELGQRFLSAQTGLEAYVSEPLAWQYGYGEFDPKAHRLAHFHELPHFTGDAWQAGAKLPDDRLGWVQLRSTGGHPGNNHQHAAVRRWVAPRDLSVAVAGTLAHGSERGDGVQAWIVSSRSGDLGSWKVHNSKQETRLERVALQAGDTLDFVVGCRESVDSDGFSWAPVIKAVDLSHDPQDTLAVEWDARQDFSGPKELPKPLTAWERYAQVLLMSNEFVFVD